MLTLCKFIRNDNPQSTNLLITRTFGKIGALHRETVAQMQHKPQAGEWWYSEVEKETGAGTERGLWVLKPVEQVARVERDGFRDHDLTYLFPSIYQYHREGNALLLYPKYQGPNWICPNSTRRHLIRSKRHAGLYQINSIVVVFDEAKEWPREYTQRNASILSSTDG